MVNSLSGRRVLVAEDEYFTAHEIVYALQVLGAEIIGPVATRAEAHKVAAHQRLDLAVLDINLAGQMVYPVADALERRAIPYVFATAYQCGSLLIPKPYSHVPCWQKPFSPADLAAAIPGLLSSLPEQ